MRVLPTLTGGMEMPKACGLLTEQGELKGGFADLAAVEYFASTLQDREVIYVLAYPVFEPNSAERIRAFRTKHEPERAKLVPPHITLVFGVANEHLQRVADLVDMASGQTKAFPVAFDDYATEFDPFEKKHKMFLLCGGGNKRITYLHNRLYEGAHSIELSSAHPFKPHMTIATYDERADVDQVDIAAVGELPIRGKLSALELVQFEDGRLTTLKTVPFIV